MRLGSKSACDDLLVEHGIAVILHRVAVVVVIPDVEPARFFVPELALHAAFARCDQAFETFFRLRGIGIVTVHPRIRRLHFFKGNVHAFRHVFEILHGDERVVIRNVTIEVDRRESVDVPIAVADARARGVKSVAEMSHKIFGADQPAVAV